MDKVVKIDAELLKKVEQFVKENRYQYTSNKQVVNLAIIEFLNSKLLKDKDKKEIKKKL